MPDGRLQRTRETLSTDYQFPTPEHVHQLAGFDPILMFGLCRCGARYDAQKHRAARPEHWRIGSLETMAEESAQRQAILIEMLRVIKVERETAGRQ